MPAQINLHELINQPGYGKAEKALRDAGKWDDLAIVDGAKEFQMIVKVSGTYYPSIETQYFTVFAKTLDDAMDQAKELSDFDEIDDCEVTNVRENQ